MMHTVQYMVGELATDRYKSHGQNKKPVYNSECVGIIVVISEMLCRVVYHTFLYS